MLLGGSTGEPTAMASNIAEIYNEGTDSWRTVPPMNLGRGHHNTVLLPDASMVTVGGGIGGVDGDLWHALPEHRQVELYDPVTGSWRLGPEQTETRAYHSTAVLLPDGRVLPAGDDHEGGKLQDTGEIYNPPYLFRGPRPTITFAPSAVRHGAGFSIGTPDTDIDQAVLIAPAETTHNTDMNQRYVALELTRRADGRGVDLIRLPRRTSLQAATTCSSCSTSGGCHLSRGGFAWVPMPPRRRSRARPGCRRSHPARPRPEPAAGRSSGPHGREACAFRSGARAPAACG